MTHRIVVFGEGLNTPALARALPPPKYEVRELADASAVRDMAASFDADAVIAAVHLAAAIRNALADVPDPPAVLELTSDSVEQAERGETGALQAMIALAAENRELRRTNRRIEEAFKVQATQIKEMSLLVERRLEKGTQALLQSELRYRELFNMANDAILTISLSTGEILDANLAAQRMLEYPLDELTGMQAGELHPPDAQPLLAEFTRQVEEAGCGVTADLPFVSKSGKRLIMSVSCSATECEGCRIAHRICRDVTELRKMQDELRQHTEELARNFHTKTQELLKSQAQLVQAEKMAALGSLVAGIAHEINTPLGSINSNNDIFALTFQRVREHLQTDTGDSEHEDAELVEETLSITEDAIRTNRMACERIVKIVRSLRNFARLDEAERKRVDVHEGIESTLTLVAHELKRRIQVVREFGNIPQIECYPNRLNQVFMNILVNASQAIEGQGEIRIRTWQQDDTVRIAFTDNGKGIPPELLPRVFDPGFTTKKAGLGTGLGLSICYRIVQDHDGRIEVESDVGRGTTFTIILPIDGAERKTNG